MPGLVVLRRDPMPFRDRLRSYEIRVDDHPVGRIAWGATERFEVSAGPHVVRLHIDWCRSQPVEINVPPGGVVSMRCRAGGSAWRFYQALFARNRYILLEADKQG